MHGDIGARQSARQGIDRVSGIAPSACPPIDRIGFDVEACGPEHTDRARHVKRRCHQQPALAGLRRDQITGENRILIGRARPALERHAIARDAETVQQLSRQRRFRHRGRGQIGAAAAEDDAGLGELPGQLQHRESPIPRRIELDSAACRRHVGIDGAAEHDDTLGIMTIGLPGRKTFGERQQGKVAERPVSHRQQQHDRHRDQTPRAAVPADCVQQHAQPEQRRERVGRHREETQELGSNEKHRSVRRDPEEAWPA